MADGTVALAHPSATIVLVRDVAEGLQVLLVRRNAKLKFHGGAWVFPGGRIDPSDHLPERPDDLLAAARRAAVRELREEASLDLDVESLHAISRWITPEILPKRFDTWFFLAPATSYDVVVDGGEIHEYRWVTPRDALEDQKAGAIELPPPTFVTLTELAGYSTVTDALDVLQASAPRAFTPRICTIEGGACSLYEGDAGYDLLDPDAPGHRHRLWLMKSGWRYERD
jgi:8-oxo-dGTP pyrophosphatase MutT (NUDIX family)